MIFDSVVADLSSTQGYGGQAFLGKFEDGWKPSQQTLNCALSVDLL
jgi:hypothetical protein